MCLHIALLIHCRLCCFFFFFNDAATTEIYTLSLHDALPISMIHEPAKMAAVHSKLNACGSWRSEEHTSELQSHSDLVCRLLLEKKNVSKLLILNLKMRTTTSRLYCPHSVTLPPTVVSRTTII